MWFPLFHFRYFHNVAARARIRKPIWHRRATILFVSDIRVRGVHHLRYAAMNREFSRTPVPGDLRTPGLWNGLPLFSVWTQAIVEPRPFCPIILDFRRKHKNSFNNNVKFHSHDIALELKILKTFINDYKTWYLYYPLCFHL